MSFQQTETVAIVGNAESPQTGSDTSEGEDDELVDKGKGSRGRVGVQAETAVEKTAPYEKQYIYGYDPETKNARRAPPNNVKKKEVCETIVAEDGASSSSCPIATWHNRHRHPISQLTNEDVRAQTEHAPVKKRATLRKRDANTNMLWEGVGLGGACLALCWCKDRGKNWAFEPSPKRTW